MEKKVKETNGLPEKGNMIVYTAVHVSFDGIYKSYEEIKDDIRSCLDGENVCATDREMEIKKIDFGRILWVK